MKKLLAVLALLALFSNSVARANYTVVADENGNLLQPRDENGNIVPLNLPIGTTLAGADILAVIGGVLPRAMGGTGTATPGLVAGANVTITGTWPNQTITSTGGSGSGGITDGDKGDITVGSAGNSFTIDNGAVTLAKLANVTGPAFLGRTGSGSGAVAAITDAQLRTALYGTFNGNFSSLGSLPTTRAGYGIIDAQPLNSNLTALAASNGHPTVVVTHKNGTATSYPAAADTDLARGTALLAAVAAASPYDSIEVNNAVFDLGNGHLTLPSDASLIGGGQTHLKSAWPGDQHSAGNALVVPGSRSVIRDLTIEGTAAPGIYQLPLGGNGFDPEYTDAVAINVTLIGDSDGFYIGSGSSISAYHCTVRTKFDAVALQGTTGSIDLFDCQLTVVGPSLIGAGTHAAGIANNAGGGTARMYGGTINVSGGADSNVAFAAEGWGTIEAYNVRIIRAEGGTGTSADTKQSGSSSIALSNVVRQDGAALTKVGEVTNLSPIRLADLTPLIGTTAATIAAGNDARITGAVQAAGALNFAGFSSISGVASFTPGVSLRASSGLNSLAFGADVPVGLSDNVSGRTARWDTSLLSASRTYTFPNAGGTFLLDSAIGTTAGTVAAGNDARITGAVQSAGALNLAGFSSISGVASFTPGVSLRASSGLNSLAFGADVPVGLSDTVSGRTARWDTSLLSASRTYAYPNKSGTYALTSDVPTIPTTTAPLYGDNAGGARAGTPGTDFYVTGGTLAAAKVPRGTSGSAVDWNFLTDADLATSDVTTNNVTTSKHGFAPKLPNDATKYLNGAGAYTVPPSGAQPYDVVQFYNASGSATTTTTVGSTTSGATNIAVATSATFAVGHGVFIAGAGTSGAKITSVSAIPDSTHITIASATNNTVGSGAKVQHDDTAAINAAIAAADAAGSGRTVYFPFGRYRINGALNGTTNSILTFPQHATYTDPYIIRLLGQGRGQTNAAATVVVAGGVTLDATDAPAGSGDYPAVISPAAYVEQPQTPLADWNAVHLYVDGMQILTAANSTLSGIMASNALRLTVGDDIQVFSLCGDGSGGYVQPTHDTVGIYCPQTQNNYDVKIGWVHIAGFDVGLVSGEHMEANKPKIVLCNVGVRIAGTQLKTSGRFIIENCGRYLESDGAEATVSFDLETEDSTGHWWSLGAADGIVDPGNVLHGRVRYLASRLVVGQIALPVDGAANLGIENEYDLPATGGSVSAPTDYLAQYKFNSALTDTTGTYNLTDHGTITYAAGKLSNAAVFNGSTQYASNASLNLSGSSFTVVGWVNFATGQNTYLACQMHSTGANNRWQLYLQTDNTINFEVVSASSPTVTSAPVSPGSWHFFAVTNDASTHVQRLKIDGGSWVTQTSTNAMNSGGTAAALGIGGRADGVASLNGSLDALAIFDRVLTDGQIAALYDSGSGTE